MVHPAPVEIEGGTYNGVRGQGRNEGNNNKVRENEEENQNNHEARETEAEGSSGHKVREIKEEDGNSHKEETVQAPAGEEYAVFEFSEADGLQPGSYNVQIDVNMQPVGIAEFRVE